MASEIKDARLLLDAQLKKVDNVIGHLVAKFSQKQPDLIKKMSEQLNSLKPAALKVHADKADDLTNIQTVNQLMEALQTAVDLELTVLFEYLFACFSVVNDSDEVEGDLGKDSAAYYSEIRREYKNQFIFICLQEMKHFRMATNMLICIGGVPSLQRVKFPSQFGVNDIPAVLSRLNLQSLLLFTKNEEPYIEDGPGVEPQGKVTREGEDGDFVFLSLAQLYEALHKGFKNIHGQIGDLMFSIKPGMQPLEGDTFGYTTLDKCLEDIDIIQTEGEGALGGKLYDDVVDDLIKWVRTVVIPPRDEPLREKLIAIGEKLKKDIDNTLQLLADIREAIKLLIEWEKAGLPPPPVKFTDLLSIQPSHWGRFLIMLINFLSLSSEIKDRVDKDRIADLFSRPSLTTPGESGYTEATGKVVEIAELSFHLLLKLLEGSIVAIPNELNDKYNISKRYHNIKFYPMMTILIFPLGEILTYFQLNEKQRESTAGFPFVPNSKDSTLVPPMDRFKDIVLSLKVLYDKSCQYFDKEFYRNLDSSVGLWLTNKEKKTSVVKRVSVLLKNIQKSIRILYLGMTNGLAPAPIKPPPPPVKLAFSESKKTPVESQTSDLTEDKDKYYLNIEFNGRAVFSQPSDPDPTFEPRGFSGNMFAYEYTQDPDFNNSFYTKNEGIYPNDTTKKFSRPYIPDFYYEGVKITAATLVIPCYYDRKDENKNKALADIQTALTADLVKSDFVFLPLIDPDGEVHLPNIPQFNYALTRHVGLDPIYVGFDSPNFSVKRANLITNPTTKQPDPNIDYVTACLQLSDNFAAYPQIINNRLPQGGGYNAWSDPFSSNAGGMANTNQINAFSGTGQAPSDFYTLVVDRSNAIHRVILSILHEYPDDEMVSLIPNFLDFYNSKLIVLALMVHLPAAVRNELSYLCSRFLQLTSIKKSIEQSGHFIAMAGQYFYQVPLNAQADGKYFAAKNKEEVERLRKIEFLDQNWGLDFWLGGMDYDALTFYISGSLMIPVQIKLDL